ncbi:MAG: hypothetical protein Satyrvirus20_7 [Satyrvirus sp.]|uniref:Uncharacterized protein n=1 Tax=Satyrvirus sp. TaxID=2487771 RepID=A0A3G5AE91_9VIRU|nr:MAG: hypothetical protein Satyrvirus20_7 [Satyrvirus sp.]
MTYETISTFEIKAGAEGTRSLSSIFRTGNPKIVHNISSEQETNINRPVYQKNLQRSQNNIRNSWTNSVYKKEQGFRVVGHNATSNLGSEVPPEDDWNNFMNMATEMPEKKNIPLAKNKTQPNSNCLPNDKNSLQAQIISLRERMINLYRPPVSTTLYHDDFVLMTKFQNKFLNMYKDWLKLIDFIIKKIAEIETKYKLDQNSNLKKIILDHIINISLSYIMMGPEANSGNGIDNLQRIGFINNKLTVKQQINEFLNILPLKVESIFQMSEMTKKLDNDHLEYLQKNDNITHSIEKLLKLVKIQTTDFNKAMNGDAKKLLKNDLDKNKILLDQHKNEKQLVQNKILEIVTKKKDLFNRIENDENILYNIFNFNYFMHDDYVPPLDYHLFSSEVVFADYIFK